MSAFHTGNSVDAQRNRNMNFFRKLPLDTLTACKELDVMHPVSRVMVLRTRGVGIITIKIDRASDCGKIHRLACYLFKVRAVTPAPTEKAAGIHRPKTDKSENSMGGAI